MKTEITERIIKYYALVAFDKWLDDKSTDPKRIMEYALEGARIRKADDFLSMARRREAEEVERLCLLETGR